MISSHPQDEGMLSDRNEQDLFQSDQNSDENYSNNQSISEADFVDDQEEDTFNYGEQNLLKQQEEQPASEKQRKQVKETCCEKLKGYFGFGTLLSSQQIGYVFFIPISSKWTFKCQVIMMQILMGLFAYGLLFTFKYATLDLSKNQMVAYSIQNFNENFENYFNQFIQTQSELLEEIIQHNKETLQIANDIVQQPNLISETMTLYSSNEQLKNNLAQEGLLPFVSQYSYEQVTYYPLDPNIPLDMKKIQKYFQLNFYLPFEFERFHQIVTMNRFVFPEDNVGILYPGITIKQDQVEFYSKYREDFDKNIYSKLDQQEAIYLPIKYDEFFKGYIAHYVTMLDQKNFAVMCIPLKKIESIFQWLSGQIEFQTYFYEKNNLTVLYGEYEGKQLVDIFPLEDEDREMFKNFTNSKDIKLRTSKSKHLFHKFEDKNFGLSILLQAISFIKIQQVAYLSLKKNKRLNQEELEKIKGDGLINQLTSLFKALISQLSGMKQGNKAKLSQHYQQQTYPKNSKPKDLSQITSYFDILQEKSTDVMLSDTNDKIQNLKLIPSFDE